VALGKPAYQASTYGPLTNASSAVDGKKTMRSCTKRSLEIPWWAVDIGQQAIIKVVIVSNYLAPSGKTDIH
jgi:hypothetical protein